MLWAWHWEPMCSPDSRRIMEYEVRKHKSKACLRYNNIPSGAEMHLLWKYPSIFINFKRVENFTFWMISNYDIRAYWYFTYHSQENTFIVNVIERKNFPYTFFLQYHDVSNLTYSYWAFDNPLQFRWVYLQQHEQNKVLSCCKTFFSQIGQLSIMQIVVKIG